MANRRRFSETVEVSDEKTIHIHGKDRIEKILGFCRESGMNIREFTEVAIDAFFANEKNRLMAMTKEQLIAMILKEGD